MRSRGIGIEQVFGKAGGFFSNFVNPIAMDAIGWKFFAIYCGWICFEFIFQFFFYPETYGRTLEELTFCKCLLIDALFENRLLTRVRKQCSKTESSPKRLSRLSKSIFITETSLLVLLSPLRSVWRNLHKR